MINSINNSVVTNQTVHSEAAAPAPVSSKEASAPEVKDGFEAQGSKFDSYSKEGHCIR